MNYCQFKGMFTVNVQCTTEILSKVKIFSTLVTNQIHMLYPKKKNDKSYKNNLEIFRICYFN